MRKVAAYCGTRNLYPYMLIAAKSLMYNSSIDKIYFMIEDDKFPFLLPDCIECINVKNQPYFKHDGPNFKSQFTYMALIRAAFTELLPDEDLILSLDVDTIIDRNIDELWDINMDNKYIAAVREPKRSCGNNYIYINFGVTLINLKLLRETKKNKVLIHHLNKYHYEFDVQDCYTEQCQGKIYELNNKYNATPFCGKITERKIIHYAGIKDWYGQEEIIPYKQMPLVKVIQQWKENRNEIQL